MKRDTYEPLTPFISSFFFSTPTMFPSFSLKLIHVYLVKSLD